MVSKPILVFGCGNPLFGDDGFGPAVIEHLCTQQMLPEVAVAIDAGTAISDSLFDLLLSPDKPLEIYIVDAVSLPNRIPGELMELKLDDIPAPKATDFCLHQFPSVNLLSEISTLVRVRVLAVQTDCLPEYVQPGLSIEVKRAIKPACEWLYTSISNSAAIQRGKQYGHKPSQSIESLLA